MKAIFVIFVVYAHTYYSAQAYNFGDLHEHVNVIEVVQRKCESNAGNTQAYYNFEEGLEVYPKCLTNAFKEDLPDPLVQYDDFCRIVRESDIYACALNLTDSFRSCLHETEAYFPDLLLTMLNTSYNEMCGVNGLSNFETFHRISASVIPRINPRCSRITGDIFRSIQIFSHSVIYRNLRESSILDLNAKDLCSDLTSIQKHVTLVMKEECSEDYSHFVDIHFQPFVDKCNDLLN